MWRFEELSFPAVKLDMEIGFLLNFGSKPELLRLVLIDEKSQTLHADKVR
jgi:hypothetical protein